MKLGQLTNQAFSDALSKLNKANLPAVTAWKLKTATTLIGAEQTKFDEIRKGLVEKYADKNEDGSIKKDEQGGFKVSEASIPEFVKEVNDLLSQDVEIPSVKIAALGEKAELSVQDLAILDGLITE